MRSFSSCLVMAAALTVAPALRAQTPAPPNDMLPLYRALRAPVAVS